MLETNRQLIDSRLGVTQQLMSFVKICGQLNEQMNKLEMLIADEKQHLDLAMLENSRYVKLQHLKGFKSFYILRVLIQQLYLQVCNIGKNLKDEMNNQQIQGSNSFIKTVETHLETFTKRQTIIIEKWSKAELKTREREREEEQAKYKILELNELQKEFSALENKMVLFNEDMTSVHSNTDLVIARKMLLAKLNKQVNTPQKENLSKMTRNIENSLQEYETIMTYASEIVHGLRFMDQLSSNLESSKSNILCDKQEKKRTEMDRIAKNLSENVALLKTSTFFKLSENELENVVVEVKKKIDMFEKKWTAEQESIKEANEFAKFKDSCKTLEQKIQDLIKTATCKYSLEVEATSKKLSDQINSVSVNFHKSKSYIEEVRTLLDNLKALKVAKDNAVAESKTKYEHERLYERLMEDWSHFAKGFSNKTLAWSATVADLGISSSSDALEDNITKVNKLHDSMKTYLKNQKSANEEFSLKLKDLCLKLKEKDKTLKVNENFNDINKNIELLDSHLEKLEKLATKLKIQIKEKELEEQYRIEAERKAKFEREEAERQAAAAPPRPPTPELEPRPVAPIFTKGLDDLVTTEGNNCCLQAEVSGIPVPKITWFKDGIAVDNNTDYIARFEKGVCSLEIEETLKEDSANWSVRASNNAGFSESHAKLTVKEVKVPEKQFPPSFIEALKDCTIKEEEAMELVCRIDGKPIPNVSWYKNGVCIDKSKNYIIGGESDKCVLRIEKAFLEDSSEFSCKISNALGQAITTAKVNVLPLNPTEAPRFIKPLENVIVRAGEEIVMECIISGLPKPLITWFKNNKALCKSNEVDLEEDGNIQRLRIKEAYPKSVGTYICKGQNQSGEALTTCTVYFKSRTPEFTDSETSEETRGQKPAFYVPLSNVEAFVGDDIILECSVAGKPTPQVEWFKDGHLLTESDKVLFEQHEDLFRVKLKKTDQILSGKYQVIARNDLGECKSSCTLKVVPRKILSSSETQTHTEEKVHFRKVNSYTHSMVTDEKVEPKFINPIQGKILEVGSSLVLEGTFTGKPAPKITWLRNNQTVPSTQVKTLRNKTVLKIESVTESQMGKYNCRAENEAGIAESICDVVVKKKTLSPVFLKRIQSKYLDIGQRLLLEVEIGGMPSPSIMWFFNDIEIVANETIQLRRMESHASLIINSVGLEQNGQYAVKIFNDAGEAVCVANVVVEKEATPPPRPPEPATDSGRDTRDHSPTSRTSRSTTSARELGPETQALRTLASFKRHSRKLPDLLPFPFMPDDPVTRPKRNNTKVPKPSKFTKGEMYYSDYESDFEGNIGVKWRATHSDNEDLDIFYRKVKPSLSKGFSQQKFERQDSPPCPHKWESHEDIEKLEREMKKPRSGVRSVRRYEQSEEFVDNLLKSTEHPHEDSKQEVQFYEATAVVRSQSNVSLKIDQMQESNVPAENVVPPPLPAKLKVNALTPSPSMKSVDSGSFSDETNFTISSLSTVQTARCSTNYIKVREKVMNFERKLEEDYLKQALEAESGEGFKIGGMRPDRLPGAIRVLPTPTPPGSRPGSRPESRSSSRKNSLQRSNSSDNNITRMFSPILTRSVQPSPIFGKRYQEHPPPMFLPPDNSAFTSVPKQLETLTTSSEPLPPSRFETPLLLDGKPRPEIDIEKTVEEIKILRNQSAALNVSVDEDSCPIPVSRSETSSSFIFKTDTNLHVTSPPPLETVDADSSSGMEWKEERARFMMNSRYQSLQRRSRSRSILSEDEEPVRLSSPKLVMMANSNIKRGSIDGYEADTDTLRSRRGSVKNIASIFERRELSNPSPVPRPASAHNFTMSTAYVPPNWTAVEDTAKKSFLSHNQTNIIRINQEKIVKSESTSCVTNLSNVKKSNFESSFSLSTSSPGHVHNDVNESPKSPVFQPKKFVASTESLISNQEADGCKEKLKIKSKWLPESVADINCKEPQFKSVQPVFTKPVKP